MAVRLDSLSLYCRPPVDWIEILNLIQISVQAFRTVLAQYPRIPRNIISLAYIQGAFFSVLKEMLKMKSSWDLSHTRRDVFPMKWRPKQKIA